MFAFAVILREKDRPPTSKEDPHVAAATDTRRTCVVSREGRSQGRSEVGVKGQAGMGMGMANRSYAMGQLLIALDAFCESNYMI